MKINRIHLLGKRNTRAKQATATTQATTTDGHKLTKFFDVLNVYLYRTVHNLQKLELVCTLSLYTARKQQHDSFFLCFCGLQQRVGKNLVMHCNSNCSLYLLVLNFKSLVLGPLLLSMD